MKRVRSSTRDKTLNKSAKTQPQKDDERPPSTSKSVESERIEDTINNNHDVSVKKQCTEYFDIKTVNNVKKGICKICRKGNVVVEIKMLQSNTFGLKRHLQSKHKGIYADLYPTTSKEEKPQS